MNQSDYEPDYIFAYQIQPERLATWKRTAEWYVPPKSSARQEALAGHSRWLRYLVRLAELELIGRLAGTRREAT